MKNLFEDIGKSSIIKNEEVLTYTYLPKILPHRENEIRMIAEAIKPLSEGTLADNLFIFGGPGLGKTASVKFVLKEFREYSDVKTFYVNCWNFRTKYFIFNEIARQLNLAFTAGKSAEHILHQIVYTLKKEPAVFVFDEIDKADDLEFLYQIVSLFQNSSIILISNRKDFVLKLEPRIKSRLMLKQIEFKPYSLKELEDIIRERAKLALKSSSYSKELITLIASATYKRKDVRIGLFLLKECAKLAEAKGLKKITIDIYREALKSVDSFFEDVSLNEEEEKIVNALKSLGEAYSGDLYEKYKKEGGTLSYRSFRRYLDRLERNEILILEQTSGGFKGRSTKVRLKSNSSEEAQSIS